MMHSTLTHCYAWKYHHPPLSEQEEVDFGNDLLEKVNDIVDLEEWVPQYINQAIIFTGDDMGGDKVMVELVVYILIVIIAFVFAVTISNTIVKEATIIGTLRASGYTKGELLRHYLILPVIITLLGAVAGNMAGYTIMKDVCVDLYYQSYSLPTYTTIWNMSAFIRTTLIPLVLMVVINTAVLMDKLRLTPLKFLRHDLKRSRQQRTLKLSPRIPFFDRYRMRIFLQNIGNYAVLVTGILFATILLLFGLALPNIIDNYQKRIEENMLSDYQYILKIPPSALNEDRKLESYINMMIYATKVETKNKTAEKFSAYTLKTLGDEAREESITCYGIIKNSRYINLPEDHDKVYISSLFAEKYSRHAGDTITLKEAYEETTYTFTVGGIYDYNGSVCLFMDQTLMNRMFHLGDSFSGYFAKTPITDIDQSCIGTVIDLRALTSLSRQLDHSMGSMTYILDGISVIIYLIVIYLLSKTIIEKNAQSISMTKILG
ncbi:MAG: FtsX-like permease family protein, partial [bacterium]